MFASGVWGDTTAVLSDADSIDGGTETHTRFWQPHQRLLRGTAINPIRTNVLKCSGAWMTDCGASSESARVRGGNTVSSFEGYGAVSWRRLVSRPLARSLRIYLGLAFLARRTDDVDARGGRDVVHVVGAHRIDLRVVLNLRATLALCCPRSRPRVYLSSVCAIAVDWRGVDGGRVGARRRDQMVGPGAGGPWGFH